jgi:hypothetical protein
MMEAIAGNQKKVPRMMVAGRVKRTPMKVEKLMTQRLKKNSKNMCRRN